MHLTHPCHIPQENSMVAAVHFPTELERMDRLAKDLDFLCGTPAWRDSDHVQRPSPAVLSYVARLREIAGKNPILLLAHSYTRYLGDLSGGQMLKRRAKKAYSLPASGEGSSFYVFPSIKSNRAFKKEYKAKLDELDLEVSTVDAMVAEANIAFQSNTDIFLEMDKVCGLELLSVPKKKKRVKPDTKTSPECPFGYVGSANKTETKVAAAITASNCPIHKSFWTSQMQLQVFAVVVAVVVVILSGFFQ